MNPILIIVDGQQVYQGNASAAAAQTYQHGERQHRDLASDEIPLMHRESNEDHASASQCNSSVHPANLLK